MADTFFSAHIDALKESIAGVVQGQPWAYALVLFGASYGYFILRTYPSDLACIGFDRTGTTHIGKDVINRSFIIPGLIAVLASCVVVGFGLVTAFL